MFVHVYECDWVVRISPLMNACVCVSRWSLTHVQTGPCLSTRHEPWSRQNFGGHSANYKTETYTKHKNFQSFFLHCISLSIFHFPLQLTGNRSTLMHFGALTKEHEINELCYQRELCTAESNPLTSADGISAYIKTTNTLWCIYSLQEHLYLEKLCEGYQGTLLNNIQP